MNNIRLIVGITGCNRLYYTSSLLKSLDLFKTTYRSQIEIVVVYVDNGSTEPGLIKELKGSSVIDELVLNEVRDVDQDVWRSKNQLITRALKEDSWIDPKRKKTNLLLMLQDDVQITNIYSLYKSVIDFYRLNMNYMTLASVRRVTLNDSINDKIKPSTSPTTGAKYWISKKKSKDHIK